jgi:hypothetical protein
MRLDTTEPQTPLRQLPDDQTRPDRLLLHDGDQVGSLLVRHARPHPGHIALIDRRGWFADRPTLSKPRLALAVSGTLRLLFPFRPWPPGTARWRSPVQNGCWRETQRLATGHGDVLEQPGWHAAGHRHRCQR